MKLNLFIVFISGMLLSLAFAPFHLTGLSFITLGALYYSLQKSDKKQTLILGGVFGLGYFGAGVSWILISIHTYGHLNYAVAILVMLGFLLFLSLYTAVMGFLFAVFKTRKDVMLNILLFASLWVSFEFARAYLFTGFPWLLIGYSQIDTPLKHLLPIIGVYGVSFITLIISGLLAESLLNRDQRHLFQVLAVSLLLMPLAFKNIHWTQLDSKSLSVGVVQSNLSMKDKWDEDLFWRILKQYHHDVNALLGTSLIILPESAIPLPYRYVSEYLNKLHRETKQFHSGLVYGIPQPTTIDEYNFYNSAATLGEAKGLYLKQHIVPFGEYIPNVFKSLIDTFNIEDPAIKSGPKQKALITLNKHTMATLLCYELAYGNILRYQLPKAEWIISLSEDGWFGRSLAIYQQLQIAQVLALETGRFHIVANNAGLSSVINQKGEIIKTLPAFEAGILKSSVIPSAGMTPWVYWGDLPVLVFCLLTILALAVLRKRRYSYLHNRLT